MNTREWLEQLVGSHVPYDQHIDRTNALIAHLDRVGWPESPKVCETCADRMPAQNGTGIDYCTRFAVPNEDGWITEIIRCSQLGGGCLVWRKRDE